MRAVKQVKKFDSAVDKDNFLLEMGMLRECSHPNVLRVFELFEDETNFYIVTEYFDGIEFLDRVNDQKEFDEDDICHIMKGIVEAINYCHNINICHRDIKPENILINTKNEIKIIDFGFAQIVSTKDKNLIGRDGTRGYMAPEVL